MVHNIAMGCRIFIVKNKVQYSNGINRRKLKVPIAFLRLLLDREGRIKQAAIFKIILFRFLQLNNKELTISADTVQVKDGFSIQRCSALVFTVAEVEFLNLMAFR